MESKPVVKISVRNLVEFVLQSGDLASGFSSSARLIEGIKGHQAVQKSAEEGYAAEVPVCYLAEGNCVDIEISGRIDGVMPSPGCLTIEEIKTTLHSLETLDRDYNPLHWAQAKCYSYIYGLQNGFESITVKLTYYNIDTEETKSFLQSFTLTQLEAFFNDLLSGYMEYAEMLYGWANTRDNSIKQLEFPFKVYRQGQRELAVAAYKTIKGGQKLFAQAPTGTGKTIATLFPAVKALGEGHTSKLFYLTAKTITRTIAEKAFENMREQGLRFRTVTITAKEKICFNAETNCDPMFCEYANGYYDRVKEAVKESFNYDCLTRPAIEQLAVRHSLCPFELSLDLSLSADSIICDYNYAFDPRVYLKRFFMQKGGDYTFLVDEAHNLVDRAREMFSAELFKSAFLKLKTDTKAALPQLSKALNKLNSYMIDLRKACEKEDKDFCVSKEPPKAIYPLLKKFSSLAEDWLDRNQPAAFREELTELYFQVQSFLRVSEFYDEKYVTYFEKSGSDVRLKLFCLDPSHLLSEAMKRAKSSILFSATLTPLEYFIRILGGDESSFNMKLPSPFPRENLCLMVDDSISTRYKAREQTYDAVAEKIKEAIEVKKGNYLAFFPSYSYMNEVHERFCLIAPNINSIVQKNQMSEAEREEFLYQFENGTKSTLIGFAVMGGIFGEGIDLTGDRLSGAIVVGVGLPQICLENDIIRKYFSETLGPGFEYAYTYPGMNRVLQAVGRVIRTETDRGMVLLIDDRFSMPLYKSLYPNEWHPVKALRKPGDIGEAVRRFWG